MISTVLYETNGVISEDRFQRMTPIQWNFQYMLIMKKKAAQSKKKFTESFSLFNMISSDIDALSMVIAPKVAEQYINVQSDRKTRRKEKLFDGAIKPREKKEADINTVDIHDERALKEVMEKYYDTAPATISVPASVMNQNRYILPKFSKEKVKRSEKKRFIQLDVPVENETSGKEETKIVPKRRHIPG